MSDNVMIAIIVCVTLAFIAMVVVLGGLARSTKRPMASPPERRAAPADEDEELDPIIEESIVKQPIPFDPENPPHRVTYTPRPDSPARICHCHDRVVQPGQQVWWWPLPNTPAVLLICNDAIPQEQA